MSSEEAFVRRFHREQPGATARALARGRVIGGAGSSYDALAAATPRGGRVLDLGCGDGYLLARLIAHGHAPAALFGLDVSADELALARAAQPAAALTQARAQALPFAAGSFGAVVSHLAWTLMPELEAIVGELARVLAPGGRFLAVVGGGPRGEDAFAGLLELAAPYAAAAPPTPRLGDARARTDAGLAALFTPAAGFAPPAIVDWAIDLAGDAAAVWAALSPSYHLATVPAAARAALEAAFLDAAPRWRRADGLIAATMYARLVSVDRRG
ncbi:MAG: class I SAM-dependent methyltransferase [Kofleriaceae bacterium]|nr:class I SAM-dependent methyltransferase [Kofleriaceae bacterium]